MIIEFKNEACQNDRIEMAELPSKVGIQILEFRTSETFENATSQCVNFDLSDKSYYQNCHNSGSDFGR